VIYGAEEEEIIRYYFFENETNRYLPYTFQGEERELVENYIKKELTITMSITHRLTPKGV
jgi:hypothetical protein